MFSDLDQKVRAQLIEQGKLVHVDMAGRILETDSVDSFDSIHILGPIRLPVDLGENEVSASWYATSRDRTHAGREDTVNSVLVFGSPEEWQKPIVRIHSSCLTGDVFGSKRCDCGAQLMESLQTITADEHGGILMYMSGHEGRGIGLWAKAAAYILQDDGQNTYEANFSLGLPDDARDYSDAAALLKYFHGNRSFRLLTNNPKKIAALKRCGLSDIARVKHVAGVSPSNQKYLIAKHNCGHMFGHHDLLMNGKAD